MRKRSKPETVLQARIVKAIEIAFPFARVLRTNSGEVRVKRGYMHLLPKGFPDIVVLLPHMRVVLLEVKTKTGASEPEQVSWGVWLRFAGYNHSVVRSQQEAINFIARCM